MGIYIVWIKDFVPCGMLLLTTREHSLRLFQVVALTNQLSQKIRTICMSFLSAVLRKLALRYKRPTVSERLFRVRLFLILLLVTFQPVKI